MSFLFFSRSLCCHAGILGLEGFNDGESLVDREGDEMETEPVLLSFAGTTVGSLAGEDAGGGAWASSYKVAVRDAG